MPDVSEIINQLKQDAPALVQNNIALAQAEIKPAVKHAGIGAGMFGGAGYFAMNAVSMLFMAGGFAFGLMWAHLFGWGVLSSAALGFATMAVVMFILVAILAVLGKKQVDQIQPPTASVAEAKATVQALTAAVQRGRNPALNGVVTPAPERRSVNVD